MKRKLIYLFIALAATILPAHAQKFLNDELTLSNVSLWQQAILPPAGSVRKAGGHVGG